MGFDEQITPIVSADYCIRLLKDENELRQYQDIRYKHLILGFDPEKAMTAPADATDTNIGYDKETSQLCALYRNPATGKEEVAGGYILMRFKREDSFCKAALKYDLSSLMNGHKYEILEATRAVIAPEHRNAVVINLLWQGIVAYAQKYNLRFVIGTMSFLGTDPLVYSEAASYLYHYYRMPDEIMVRPLKNGHDYYHEIIPKCRLDRAAAIRQLPPLLRGYLGIGAQTCDGFYIDRDLKTVETLAILDMKNYGKCGLK